MQLQMLTLIMVINITIMILSTTGISQVTGSYASMSAYECGFNSLKNINNDLMTLFYFFYSLMFLLFDIELCLLIPASLSKLTLSGMYSPGLLMSASITILFLYELNMEKISWYE